MNITQTSNSLLKMKVEEISSEISSLGGESHGEDKDRLLAQLLVLKFPEANSLFLAGKQAADAYAKPDHFHEAHSEKPVAPLKKAQQKKKKSQSPLSGDQLQLEGLQRDVDSSKRVLQAGVKNHEKLKGVLSEEEARRHTVSIRLSLQELGVPQQDLVELEQLFLKGN